EKWPAREGLMKIAQIAPLWVSVPPADYGGTELIVHLLTEELMRRGHEVTLFASGDSRSSARLRSVQSRNVIDIMAKGEAYEYDHYANALLAEAVACSDAFDLIHIHLGCACVPFALGARAPVLHTLHTPLSIDDQWVLQRY